MDLFRVLLRSLVPVMMFFALMGCEQPAPTHALDSELARASVEKAMQAWVDGKTPQDLLPIVVGDPAWEKGKKLTSFEILMDEETSDGSNLHIRVNRKFTGGDGSSESKVTYIVGTTPVVTIFPQ